MLNNIELDVKVWGFIVLQVNYCKDQPRLETEYF